MSRGKLVFLLPLAALLTLLGCAGDPAGAPPARIAVAANFAATAEALREAFAEQGDGAIDLVVGSTGALHAQITAGAPFDAFLAADTARPDRLVADGLADPGSRFVYALGRLALWIPRGAVGDDPAAVLRNTDFEHLAIADPAVAPYGAAAVAYLRHAGLHDALASRLVMGQSVAQAYQFTAGGNAELGLVALSQVISPDAARTGSVLPIPAPAHPPLAQAAVALTDHPTARAFLAFLRHHPAARAVIAGRGYDLPAAESERHAERR